MNWHKDCPVEYLMVISSSLREVPSQRSQRVLWTMSMCMTLMVGSKTFHRWVNLGQIMLVQASWPMERGWANIIFISIFLYFVTCLDYFSFCLLLEVWFLLLLLPSLMKLRSSLSPRPAGGPSLHDYLSLFFPQEQPVLTIKSSFLVKTMLCYNFGSIKKAWAIKFLSLTLESHLDSFWRTPWSFLEAPLGAPGFSLLSTIFWDSALTLSFDIHSLIF